MHERKGGARIVGAAEAVPGHVIEQKDARAACARVYAGQPHLTRLLRVMDTSGVLRRRFSFPPGYYLEGRSFEERNRDYLKAALDLSEKAARSCIGRTGVEPGSIDHLIITTTTGLATPSLDAHLVERLELPTGVRRWPLFGLGCAGGAGALLRAADLVRGGGTALVLAVEVCGQVFSPRALRPVDAVSSALFGDGAAAVLVEGGEGDGPRVRAGRTRLFPGTGHLMGWRFTDDGMRIILSREVADFVGDQLRPEADRFLRESGIATSDIRWWMLHPGGRRIIDAYGRSFGLDEDALKWTRASLGQVGNVSSASALMILSDVIAKGKPAAGDLGLVIGLGPGFSAEMALLEW